MKHDLLDAAIQAVLTAAELCRTIRSQPEFESHAKKDRTPVTVADYGSQALICKALSEAFPDIPIVAEEGAEDLRKDEGAKALAEVTQYVQNYRPDGEPQEICEWIDLGAASPPKKGPFWTLDPIDGTKGFLRNEHYAVALALIDHGQLELAVMACPGYNALYVAIKEQGVQAYPINGEGSVKPIQISHLSDISEARLCESVESSSTDHGSVDRVIKELRLIRPPLKIDSQAKYAAVAQGEAEIYLRISPVGSYREKIWDHAAGALIVTEAGGVVSDLDGKPFDFRLGRTLEANRGVVVAIPTLHDKVIAAIRNLGKNDPSKPSNA